MPSQPKPQMTDGGKFDKIQSTGPVALPAIDCRLRRLAGGSMVPARNDFASLSCVSGGEQCLHKMFYTYVLQSKKDNNLYIGYTDDLKARFGNHNKGLVDATKGRRPFILVYYEACLKEKKAIEREKYFKTGFGRRFLNNRI